MSTYRKSQRLQNRLQVTRHTQKQREFLESYFKNDTYPHLQQRTEIAKLIGLHQNQVSIWFNNRRRRLRDEVDRRVSELVDHPSKVRRRYPSAVSYMNGDNGSGIAYHSTQIEPNQEQQSFASCQVENIEWFLQEIPDLEIPPFLPNWPTKLKYVPFQQKLFNDGDLCQIATEENEVEKPTVDKKKRRTRKSETGQISGNEKNQSPEATMTNTEILKDLVAKIETIRQDTLYVPVMDEISGISSECTFDVDSAPSTEQALMRSVRQLMEPSGLVKNLEVPLDLDCKK